MPVIRGVNVEFDPPRIEKESIHIPMKKVLIGLEKNEKKVGRVVYYIRPQGWRWITSVMCCT